MYDIYSNAGVSYHNFLRIWSCLYLGICRLMSISLTSNQFDRICMLRSLLYSLDEYNSLKTLAEKFCAENSYNFDAKYILGEKTDVVKLVFSITQGKEKHSVLSVTIAYGYESHYKLVESEDSLEWKLVSILGDEALQKKLE